MLELLVTIAIVAILVALGVPALSDFTQRAQVRTETQRFVGIISLARSTAITQNQVVTIQVFPAAAGQSAPIEISVDSDGDGNADTLVNRFEAEPTTLNVTTMPAGLNMISFNQNGRLLTPNFFQLAVENQNQNLGRTIVVNASGRSTVTEIEFN